MKKDVIYIDVEDDITAIIEKLKASKAKIVALVPPKRSTILSSAVNTKLLKRAAEDAGKRVVLITSDASLLALAGGLGLHVAKNLQSKPYLPDAPEVPIAEDNVIEGDLNDLDPEAAVGALAGAAGVTTVVSKKAKKSGKKSANKDDAKDESTKEKSSKKGFHIPNFEKFRLKILLGAAGAVTLAIFWWWAVFIAPGAIVNIQAQTSQLDTAVDYSVDTNVESSNIETMVLRGTTKELKKTVTEDFVATGEDNVGAKSTGTMTVQNCNSSSEITVAAGTVFTSGSGLKFVSSSAIAVPGGSFDFSGCTAAGVADTTVNAVEAGDNYNLAPTSYSTTITGLSGSGGQMSGGTTVVKKVVSQDDFDKAKANLTTKDYSTEKEELAQLFGDGLTGLDETFEFKIGKVSSAPAVGAEGEKAILSAEITFTEVGVSNEDLDALLAESQDPRVDMNTQSIYDNGRSIASQEMIKDDDKGKYDFRMRTVGIVGPNINTEALADQIAGKRYSEAKGIIDDIPGVVSSEIKLSPFWVNKVPGPNKTTINVEVSEQNLQ